MDFYLLLDTECTVTFAECYKEFYCTEQEKWQGMEDTPYLAVCTFLISQISSQNMYTLIICLIKQILFKVRLDKFTAISYYLCLSFLSRNS